MCVCVCDYTRRCILGVVARRRLNGTGNTWSARRRPLSWFIRCCFILVLLLLLLLRCDHRRYVVLGLGLDHLSLQRLVVLSGGSTVGAPSVSVFLAMVW